MQPQTIRKLLVWLLASSVNKFPHFHYFAYEPLVSFDLMKETTEWGVNLLRGTERRFKWGVTTNLTLLTDRVNKFLKKHNFYVLCSIDGTKEGHDVNRVYPDGSGSWDDAIRGLKRVIQWEYVTPSGEKPGRTVRWTISPDTVDQIVPGTELFLDMGVRNIAHEFVMETRWSRDDLDNLTRELCRLIPILIEYTKRDDPPMFKPFRDGGRCLGDWRMTDRCGLAGGDLGVNVEGEFFLCHRFVDQSEHQIGTVWKGLDLKKIEGLRKNWLNKVVAWDGSKDTCYSCPARIGCNSGCLATNYDTTGNLFQPPKAFCDIMNVKAKVTRDLVRELRRNGLLEKYGKKIWRERR